MRILTRPYLPVVIKERARWSMARRQIWTSKDRRPCHEFTVELWGIKPKVSRRLCFQPLVTA
jgi:hypothetical protein